MSNQSMAVSLMCLLLATGCSGGDETADIQRSPTQDGDVERAAGNENDTDSGPGVVAPGASPECEVGVVRPKTFTRPSDKGELRGVQATGLVSCSAPTSLSLEVCLQWKVAGGTWENVVCLSSDRTTDELQLEAETGCPFSLKPFRSAARLKVQGTATTTDWKHSDEVSFPTCP